MEPIFNKKVTEKCILWDPWTVYKNTVHIRKVKKLLLDKKKKNLWNVNVRLESAKRASQTHSKWRKEIVTIKGKIYSLMKLYVLNQ